MTNKRNPNFRHRRNLLFVVSTHSHSLNLGRKKQKNPTFLLTENRLIRDRRSLKQSETVWKLCKFWLVSSFKIPFKLKKVTRFLSSLTFTARVPLEIDFVVFPVKWRLIWERPWKWEGWLITNISGVKPVTGVAALPYFFLRFVQDQN